MFKHIFYIKILIIFIYSFLSIANAKDIYLSLKKDKVNVRYGPSFESPIKFVYRKIDLPIKLIDKKENFRRIIDFKNNSGWIHVSQLKIVNSIIPLTDRVLFKKPSKFSKPLANVKKGRVLIVLKFDGDWCKVQSGRFKGWIINDNLWGKIN
tara:strand:+ start:135 stop:590 length:456 start_codon:yes stop_codon:yes gene_type:complete